MAKDQTRRPVHPRHIVVGATDDNMVYPAIVWAHALHDTAATPPHVVLGYFEGLLSAQNLALLEKSLTHLGISHEFRRLELDPRFITQGHISPTTFTKFLLADEITSEHVWIDIDTVAMPGWDAIFTLLEDTPEDTRLVVAKRGDRGPGRETAPPKPSDLAFNAGVLGWPARERIPWSADLDTIGEVETQEQYLFNTLYSEHLSRIPEVFNMLTYRCDNFQGVPLPFIIHYAGAHKPWHMPRRFTTVCDRHGCPWSVWFSAEEKALEALASSPRIEEIRNLRGASLRSGQIGKSRDYSGRLLLKRLDTLGIFGWLVVLLAKPLGRFIPRGTHPLH